MTSLSHHLVQVARSPETPKANPQLFVRLDYGAFPNQLVTDPPVLDYFTLPMQLKHFRYPTGQSTPWEARDLLAGAWILYVFSRTFRKCEPILAQVRNTVSLKLDL